MSQAGFTNNSSTTWNYFHINFITKDDDGHYVLSARHVSIIYKINETDGTVIWRLEENRSDFVLGPNVTFGFQHHARYAKNNTSSLEVTPLFDNSVYGSEAGGGGDKKIHLYSFSREKYIRLDYESKTAILERVLHFSNNSILSSSQKSLQTPSNANVLIDWGSENQVIEYSPIGEPGFHVFLNGCSLQEKVQNYRTFP